MKASNFQINVFHILECATLHNVIKGLQQTIEFQHDLKGELEKNLQKYVLFDYL